MTKQQIAALLKAYKLKALPRAGWLRAGLTQVESVAAHTWGLALLASLLCPPQLNRSKTLELAILHDLAESEVGDITPHDAISQSEKISRELSAMRSIAQNANAPHWLALFEEYTQNTSPEAQFVHKLDKLDMALQAKYYEDLQDIDLSEFYANCPLPTHTPSI